MTKMILHNGWSKMGAGQKGKNNGIVIS